MAEFLALPDWANWAIPAGCLLVGCLIGLVVDRRGFGRERGRLRHEAEAKMRAATDKARHAAAHIRSEAESQGRAEVLQMREAWANEQRRRRAAVERMERRTDERMEELERKEERLSDRQERLDRRRARSDSREAELDEAHEKAEVERLELARAQRLATAAHREAQAKLEDLAGISHDEARARVMREAEAGAEAEANQMLRRARDRARSDAEHQAKKIISQAIERLSVDHASEMAVSVVHLPGDEMKGRIIGREGRNIRAFEAATGVDVVVDDTPESVILSCFDPVRREIARVAMESLVSDGRINFGRIEEVVGGSRRSVEKAMSEAAEEVLYELGIHRVEPRIRKVLGRLRYRASYGQNQLAHAREVALIASVMAGELGLDQQMTRRMGLFHDIGKGLTQESGGSHVELGHDLCKRHGEPDQVLNAIMAHHGDEPARYPETFLVTAADAISGARPGARRESFEHYVERLEKLEALASRDPAVHKAYAIKAGREIRIMVMPEKVGDTDMDRLAQETAERIESRLQYPGQIRVIVVRETRSVSYAR